jgi:hypothetical protein
MTRCSRPAPAYTIPLTLETIAEDHVIQRLLCNDLEALADRLPALPPLPAIRKLCDRVHHVTTTHFSRAEMAFNALPLRHRPEQSALAGLRQMHHMDELHAEDLVSALWQHALQPDRREVGQLAYMLRCFFDGCRRAIALKESWIRAAESPVAGQA